MGHPAISLFRSPTSLYLPRPVVRFPASWRLPLPPVSEGPRPFMPASRISKLARANPPRRMPAQFNLLVRSRRNKNMSYPARGFLGFGTASSQVPQAVPCGKACRSGPDVGLPACVRTCGHSPPPEDFWASAQRRRKSHRLYPVGRPAEAGPTLVYQPVSGHAATPTRPRIFGLRHSVVASPTGCTLWEGLPKRARRWFTSRDSAWGRFRAKMAILDPSGGRFQGKSSFWTLSGVNFRQNRDF